jgi:signal transduction histidine kinase/CheY-like chemotaxis protein
MTTAAEARIDLDRISALYREGPRASLIAVVVGACIVAALWNRISHTVLLFWYALVCANQAWRIGLCAAFRRRSADTPDISRWARRYQWTMAVGAALWGSVAFVLFPSDVMGQAILIIVICGLAAGSVTANAYHPPTMNIYLVLIQSPMILRLATLGGTEYAILAFASGFYLVLVYIFAQNQARLIRESIEIRHRNVDLIEALKAKTEIAEAAQRRAEQASLAKSRFFAAASHDLRQPLQALGCFAASLRQTEDRAAMEHKIEQILASVDALESLFDELLDISRLDAGYIQPQPRHFEADGLLVRLRATFTPAAEAAGLTLRFRHGGATLFTDPVLLERILSNFVANALRYTRQGGVLVGYRRRGALIRMEVWDTGIGIAAEEFDHIFDEFYQIGNPERDRRHGLGLGLATVRRISGLLNCPVSLASRPGRGSVFRVDVPAGDPAQVRPPAPSPVEAATNPLGGRCVLVIEDDAAVRDGLIALLGQWGCVSVAAAGLKEALEILNSRGVAPEAVIADHRLRAGETGIYAIDRLRAAYGQTLPALLVTGDIGAEMHQAAASRQLLLLHKPVRAVRLRAALAHLFVQGPTQARHESDAKG